ncbi:MAG: hypothetical protein Q9180_009397 [Flavoplaca navasiana]
MVSSNISHAPQISIPPGTKATTSPPHRQQPQVFSLSRSRPAFDTSIFHPSFSNFERNFKAFTALVDLVEERARFYETLSVEIKKGGDDRYRDYDKDFRIELSEREYLRQWSGDGGEDFE